MSSGRQITLFMLVVLFIIQGCGSLPKITPSPVRSTPINLSTFAPTSAPNPTATSFTNPMLTMTATPIPAGVFPFFFYSPLVMNYDTSQWKFENELRSQELPGCTITEQGPTDFNGPHDEEITRLGEIHYTMISFPESPSNENRVVYLAEQSLATDAGLPVFWVSSKPDEWDHCQLLAEQVLATLHFP